MSRSLVERYWQAQDPYDPAALATLAEAYPAPESRSAWVEPLPVSD